MHVITHSSEPAPRLIWIYAIGIGAFQGMNAILALFLAARFGVTSHTIGYFYTYIGVISVLTRALILGWAVDRFGEARLSRLGQTLLAIGLAAMPFMHRMADPAAFAARLGGILPVSAVAFLPFLPLALAVALLPLGTAFTFPCVTALLSRVIPSSERGLYMGVQQTFGGTARVSVPDRGRMGVRSVSRSCRSSCQRAGRWHDSLRAGYGGVHPAEARTRGCAGGLVARRSRRSRL